MPPPTLSWISASWLVIVRPLPVMTCTSIVVGTQMFWPPNEKQNGFIQAAPAADCVTGPGSVAAVWTPTVWTAAGAVRACAGEPASP